jgi:hypothetical protein
MEVDLRITVGSQIFLVPGHSAFYLIGRSSACVFSKTPWSAVQNP